MFIAKVVGSVVSTQKVGSMTGHKLMLVEPFRVEANKRESLTGTGRSLISVDTLGAGVGDYVLVTQGSSARLTEETKKLPIDAIIIGIVDRVQLEQQCIYDREDEAE